MKTIIALGMTLALAMAGCDRAATTNTAANALPAPAPAAPLPPVEPPAPGTPGGLPDDRTPLSEAPFTPDSAQGAAQVLQTYFALLTEHKYDQAYALWGDAGRSSGLDAAAFKASFDKYASYNAQVGGPGRIDGAAGSLFVEIPVVIYGRMKTGEAVHMNGPVTLRRVNDVPSSTPEQRLWRLYGSGLKPSPVPSATP